MIMERTLEENITLHNGALKTLADSYEKSAAWEAFKMHSAKTARERSAARRKWMRYRRQANETRAAMCLPALPVSIEG